VASRAYIPCMHRPATDLSDSTTVTPPLRFRDDSPWQEVAGYSRGARVGDLIAISGTTALPVDGTSVGAMDTYEQTHQCLERVIKAALNLGASRSSILRTRIYLVPHGNPEQASQAHRDLLGDVSPANTLVFVAGLVGDELLVEVELEARTADAG
jgi:enamine deaminase RidA (YjgF/YER057c/UK114 family)